MTENNGSPTHGSPGLSDRLIWSLVALSPFLFALLTWSPDGHIFSAQGTVLRFSVPITAVEIAVILFAVLVGCGPLHAVRQMPGWVLAPLGLLIAIAIAAASLTATDRTPTMVRTYAWLIHLLFGLCMWRLFRTRWAALRPVTWPSAVIGVLLYVLVLVALVLAIPDEQTFDWKHLRLGVTHVRQVGFYSVVGAAAAIGLAAIATSRGRCWRWVAAASLCLALSYWSGTRGSLVAVLAAFVTGLVLLPAMRTLRSVAAFACANIAGVLLSLLHLPPDAFYGIFRISQSTMLSPGATAGHTTAVGAADELASGRLTMWSMSAQAMLDRPLLGYGESQFRTAVPAFAEFNHPHNVIFQIGVSWGLIGLACFLGLAFILAWNLVLAARSGSGELVPPFLVAVSLAIMSLYEGSLYHPYPVMMTTVAVAFVLSSRQPLPAPNRAAPLSAAA